MFIVSVLKNTWVFNLVPKVPFLLGLKHTSAHVSPVSQNFFVRLPKARPQKLNDKPNERNEWENCKFFKIVKVMFSMLYDFDASASAGSWSQSKQILNFQTDFPLRFYLLSCKRVSCEPIWIKTNPEFSEQILAQSFVYFHASASDFSRSESKQSLEQAIA